MEYRVIETFCDMEDNGYQYSVGDLFPRLNHSATQVRFDALASSNNKLGRPLIKSIAVIKETPAEITKEEKPKTRKSKTPKG